MESIRRCILLHSQGVWSFHKFIHEVSLFDPFAYIQSINDYLCLSCNSLNQSRNLHTLIFNEMTTIQFTYLIFLGPKFVPFLVLRFILDTVSSLSVVTQSLSVC